MAGSGEFTRKGNLRAENANLMSMVTGGINAPGDQVAALSTSLAAGVATTASTAASGGGAIFTKPIADKSILAICDAAGAVDQMETVTVNGAIAISATSFTFASQTIRVAHAAGSLVVLLAFKAYLALYAAGVPTDNTLGTTEIAFTGYARQLLPFTPPTVADPPVAANSALITFGPMSNADGTKVVTYGELLDTLSGGTADNAYAWWTWAATRTPNANDSIQIAAAALTMQSFH